MGCSWFSWLLGLPCPLAVTWTHSLEISWRNLSSKTFWRHSEWEAIHPLIGWKFGKSFRLKGSNWHSMTLRTIPCTCTMRPDSWVISGVTAGNGSIIFRWRIVRCHVWLQGKYCTVWIHQKTMNTRFQALNFHPHSCHSSFMIFMFLTVLTFCRLLFLSWPWYMLWVVFFICPYLYHLQRYHSWCLDLICLSVQYRIPLVWMLYELLLSTACWNLCGWSLSLSTSVAMVDHAERFHIYI